MTNLFDVCAATVLALVVGFTAVTTPTADAQDLLDVMEGAVVGAIIGGVTGGSQGAKTVAAVGAVGGSVAGAIRDDFVTDIIILDALDD